MPLPHFLMLVAAVVLAAGLTLLLALAVGIPLPVLTLGLVVAALAVHVLTRGKDRMDGGSHPTPEG